MEKVLNIFNVILLFFVFMLFCSVYFIAITYGKIDIANLLYFMRFNDLKGISATFGCNVLLNCLLFPIFFTCLVLFLLKKLKKNDNKAYVFPIVFWGYSILIVLLADKYLNSLLTDVNVIVLSLVLLLIYVFILNRNYSVLNIFILILFLIFEMYFICNKKYSDLFDLGEFGETNFYKENYKEAVGKNTNKRNVIVVFLESFNEEYSRKLDVKVNDNDAVKFDNFIEGYVQRWTQAALFSAFTGTHIHYLSDFFKYEIKFKKILESYIFVEESNNANSIGELYNFYTPKINSLGKIAKKNGYQNIFVQGSDVNFSGTRDFLLNNGFDKYNIYGYDELINKVNIKKMSGTMLDSIADEKVYSIFKDKIIDKKVILKLKNKY